MYQASERMISLNDEDDVPQDGDGYCLAEVRCGAAEYEAGGDPQGIDWATRFHTREQLSVRHDAKHRFRKMWLELENASLKAYRV